MALDRLTPTSGPKTGTAYAAEVQEEVTGLWDRSTITLTSVSGTNTITATATPALTGALGGSMNFILKPAATNTGAVTLNINGGGAVAVVDAEGTALAAGALRINANYLLHYDSGISKHVVVGYIPAAVVPVGYKMIKTQTASASASIDFFHGSGGVVFDDTYDAYELVVSNAKPSTDDVEAWIRVGTGGTPTYQTASYQYGINLVNSSAGGETFSSTSASSIKMSSTTGTRAVGNASGENFSGKIFISNPEATDYPQFTFDAVYSDSGGFMVSAKGAGRHDSLGGITAIRFMFESGNIVSGRFTLYGYAKV